MTNKELLDLTNHLRNEADHPRMDTDWNQWIQDARKVLRGVNKLLAILVSEGKGNE